jgi:hypothetical protein
MARGSPAGDVGRARSQIPSEVFVLQEDGKLRCPAGASLWLSEVRQENAFTEVCRLVFPTRPTVSPALSESSVWHRGPKAIVLVVSALFAVSCPLLLRLEQKLVHLGPMRWVDVAGRALRAI